MNKITEFINNGWGEMLGTKEEFEKAQKERERKQEIFEKELSAVEIEEGCLPEIDPRIEYKKRREEELKKMLNVKNVELDF